MVPSPCMHAKSSRPAVRAPPGLGGLTGNGESLISKAPATDAVSGRGWRHFERESLRPDDVSRGAEA